MSDDYISFLASKLQYGDGYGFEPLWMPDFLFDFQHDLTGWSIRQGRAAILADCGLGKAQPVSESVLTPAGWQNIGDLTVGSRVIANDGTSARVVGVYPQGVRPTYQITFSDGASVRCDKEHLWAVRSDNHHRRDQPWKVLSTAELMAGELRYNRKDDVGTFNWRIPICQPVQLENSHPLSMDPYILGVLLGDGCLTRPDVTFTAAESDIAERVRSRLPDGIRLVRKPNYGEVQRTPEYRISGSASKTNAILGYLRRSGLMGKYSYQKHVPADFLTATVTDRLELLRGLLDTDGESNRSYVQFCSTSRQLADDVVELTRSLGGTARINSKLSRYIKDGVKVECKVAYLVQIRLPVGIQPFACRRKADRYQSRKRLDPVRKITSIESSNPEECVCIAIDNPSQLYVTRDYVVTHNTPMSLVWAENVHRKTGKPVLLLTPLGVAFQIEDESEKFEVSAKVSRNGKPKADVTITNYEQLAGFDPDDFGGLVCDESSILKNFDGKTKAMITEFARRMPYRLLDTATAAPNDFVELGTSSEALGYLGHIDMLNRFFTNKNKTSDVKGHWRGHDAPRAWERQQWRFKNYAEEHFWRWVASWARACRKPSDLGFSDEGYELPPLEYRRHVLQAREQHEGTLFDVPAVGFREEREEQRRTIPERCEMAAGLLADADRGVAWCQRNAEGDLLTDLIDGAVQVSGADSLTAKEEKLVAFTRGEIRVLVTKPVLGAWGLNWQHCNRVTYFPSHSFEQMYQAVRRCWRFGQVNPVTVDLITTEGGLYALENVERKAQRADEMFDSIVKYMRDAMSVPRDVDFPVEMELPAWAR